MAKNRLKTVSLVILITLLGKVLGLGRDMLMGQNFGTGLEADALFAASQLPRMLFDAVFASAVSASFIPAFNDALEKNGRSDAEELANGFFTIVGISGAALSALGMLLSPNIIAVIANFDAQTAALSASLLRIIFPSLFFTGIAFSMVGVLQSFEKFHLPAAMSALSNGILIVYFLFFASRFGVQGAAVAMLIGWIAQALIQLPGLYKLGHRYRVRFWHPGLRDIGRLMLPVMVSTWIAPINMAVLLWFATQLPGGASSITLANGLYLMVAGIFVLSVTNVIFPQMSKLAATSDEEGLAKLVDGALGAIIALLLPMAVGLMVLATPIIRLLYEYRAFDATSTVLTSSALFYMAIGMLAFGLQSVLIRAFYAKKRGRPPLIAGAVGLLANLLLSAWLVGPMGVSGLALATALSMNLVTILLIIPAKGMLVGVFSKGLIETACKALISVLLMAPAVHFTHYALSAYLGDTVWHRLLQVAVPIAVGMLVYGALAWLLGMKELQTIKNMLTRKRGAHRGA